MKKEQGSLAINSDNIFPIIKKWLYSDHEIEKTRDDRGDIPSG